MSIPSGTDMAFSVCRSHPTRRALRTSIYTSIRSAVDMAMASNRRVRPEDEVEKVYQITGTSMSFSANQIEFDGKAMDMILGYDTVVVRNDLLEMEPEGIPGDRLFFSKDPTRWSEISIARTKDMQPPPNGWRSYGSFFGYGIPGGDELFGYKGFKQTYVFYKDNQKTNWFKNIYHTIGRKVIQAVDISLCHVFQSHSNYDPFPKSVPIFSDYDPTVVHSYAVELESWIKNPKAFMDFEECNKNFGAYPTRIGNDRGKKRSKAWEDFTEIQVLGPDGVVMLTLAICQRCNIAYKTGSMTDSGFNNNGTKTLTKHSRKCNGKHHIAGDPQEAPHN